METTQCTRLFDTMDPSWQTALADLAPHIDAMQDFIISEHEHNIDILPQDSQILRAFMQPVNNIKVLIVGQDPYPTPGHAVGLSFCVAPTVQPLPKSLINIYKELVSDLGVPQPHTGDLTPWTQQGVMLLNRVLTVRAGQANSHQGKGWEIITETAIKILNERTDNKGNPLPLVAILWGKQARELKKLLSHATIIESAHPSPLSAYRGFFGSRPFSQTNVALENKGIAPIHWQLP